jgi:benzodiazapine receptor
MTLPRHLQRTSAAVAATAGGLGTDVKSRWYSDLEKPTWQPPGAAFGPAWTTLYALMALTSARTLDRLEPQERRGFATAFGANLVLNAGWSWLFCTARRPRWAPAEIVLLEASNLYLTRRAAKVDSRAAPMFVLYAGWVAFATALNAAIAHRNPEGELRDCNEPRLAAPAEHRRGRTSHADRLGRTQSLAVIGWMPARPAYRLHPRTGSSRLISGSPTPVHARKFPVSVRRRGLALRTRVCV